MTVVTFGEALFRLSSAKGERLRDAQSLQFHLGGTELNIAGNLTSLGVKSKWISALPDGMTGELMRNKIQHLGVSTEGCVSISHGRAGWYLVEAGAAPRPDLVYNRYASSFAEQTSFRFDWKSLLQGAKIFHTSGITAGLSLTLTAEVKKAMEAARAQGTLVSYDFNYRKNIWSIEEFTKRQKDLIPLIDILFCGESDLELFFGKDPQSQDYTSIFNQTKLKLIVIASRNADESDYGVKVVSPTDQFISRRYAFQNLDRIGVGDSMAAGFLAAYLSKNDLKLATEYASVAGALKYGIKGDMALLSVSEIESIIQNGIKGIVR